MSGICYILLLVIVIIVLFHVAVANTLASLLLLQLYVEEEDYESLSKSVDAFQNFNMIALASKLATHELLEFRRMSAYVYRNNNKWNQSIELSKNDRM